jgi:hypothetical protein
MPTLKEGLTLTTWPPACSPETIDQALEHLPYLLAGGDGSRERKELEQQQEKSEPPNSSGL